MSYWHMSGLKEKHINSVVKAERDLEFAKQRFAHALGINVNDIDCIEWIEMPRLVRVYFKRHTGIKEPKIYERK
jgi:hypothetical protein